VIIDVKVDLVVVVVVVAGSGLSNHYDKKIIISKK
jgi:hypothetical protein